MRNAPLFAAPLFALAIAAPAVAGAAQPESPMPWLKAQVERGRQLADQRPAAGSPAEAKWNADVKSAVDDVLDWQDLTQAALGRYWAERTPAEQKEFSALLREMVEASYQSKLKLTDEKKAGGAKKDDVVIEWTNEEVKGDRATATAKVKAGKTSNAVLEFKLRWADGRWRVSDVSIDDVSTVRTYKTQFAKIIDKSGYPALLKRMRAKIEDIRAGRTDISPTRASVTDDKPAEKAAADKTPTNTKQK